MKKLSLLIMCMGFTVLSMAQSSTFRAFKVDIGFGYADPTGQSGTTIKGGATFTVEPHYRLSDAVAIGIRFEGALVAAAYDGNSSGNSKASTIESYCPTFEYYLMNSGFRPFIGAGAGLFSRQAFTLDNNSASVPSVSEFGFFPRIGFEAGHFRLSGEYNILSNSLSYAAIKIGFFLGGGKK
jgi:hypothetical protein